MPLNVLATGTWEWFLGLNTDRVVGDVLIHFTGTTLVNTGPLLSLGKMAQLYATTMDEAYGLDILVVDAITNAIRFVKVYRGVDGFRAWTEAGQPLGTEAIQWAARQN
jgi:hypothetical protein